MAIIRSLYAIRCHQTGSNKVYPATHVFPPLVTSEMRVLARSAKYHPFHCSVFIPLFVFILLDGLDETSEAPVFPPFVEIGHLVEF